MRKKESTGLPAIGRDRQQAPGTDKRTRTAPHTSKRPKTPHERGFFFDPGHWGYRIGRVALAVWHWAVWRWARGPWLLLAAEHRQMLQHLRQQGLQERLDRNRIAPFIAELPAEGQVREPVHNRPVG